MININGQLLKPEAANLSVVNRGFTYGDAVFETIRVINGKIIFWEDHYFRLMSSIRIMRMEIPLSFSPEFLEKEIMELITANLLENSAARVRLNVFRGSGGYYTPTSSDSEYVISAEALPSSFYLFEDRPYEVELYKDHYVTGGLLSTIKTNNRAVNVLGSIFARENGYQNCLLLNESKNVVGALNGNLFLVKGNIIKTPPLSDGCLRGITRGKLLEIIKNLPDWELEEQSISPFELQKADELFISNVAVGVKPISKYRKKEFSVEVGRNLLGKLNARARLD